VVSQAFAAGIDSSTQSTKVELRDIETGELIASGRSAHPATTPPRSEQDPEAWWSALVDACSQIDDSHLKKVKAVAVAGQQHGLVLLGDDGVPLRPAKLWNDTESAPQAEALVRDMSPGGWVKACGSVPSASFTVTKLAWVVENEPELLARIGKIMLPHDYLTWRLTGQHVTDRGDASGTGWWSPRTGGYQRHLLDRVRAGLSNALPRVCDPRDDVGEVVAGELGIPRTAVVAPGTGDNMAGALGLGLRPGDLAISIGTSGTAYAVSSTPTADASGLVAGFADATGNFLPLVCTLNATKVTEVFRNLIGADYDEFDQLALDTPLGADGAVLIPYLDGERTPNRPTATGLLTGFRSNMTRGQIARAAFEGVACGLLDGVAALESAGVTADERTFLIGGGAKSEAYRRVVADLSGRTVIVPADDETVATGACVQAAAVQGKEDFAEVARRWGLGEGTVVQPGKGSAAAAQEARERYRATRDLA
jgi:xylulokinase